MIEGVGAFDAEEMKEAKKPLIFCVTPNLKKKRFMLGEISTCIQKLPTKQVEVLIGQV